MSLDKKTSVEYAGEEYEISTVKLPMEHHGGQYETCVFWDGGSRVTERYESKEQAKEGHETHVEAFESGNVEVQDTEFAEISIGDSV